MFDVYRRSSRPIVSRATVCGLLLLAIYLSIGTIEDGGAARNDRRLNLLQSASATTAHTLAVTPSGSSLVVHADAESSAAWNISSYELSHLLNRASSCSIEIILLNTSISSVSPSAWAEIQFDDRVVKRIRFSEERRGFYAAGPGRYFPSNVVPQSIDIVPLDRRFGFAVPLAASACAAKNFTVSVRTRDVDWNISYVGLLLKYTPARVPLFNSGLLTVIAGVLIAATLVGLIWYVLLCFSSLGIGPLITAAAIMAVSPLTYDQWDFAVWMRFSEMATFGGASPTQLWAASPLWALVPPLFSTITLASYVVTGDGSRALTELFLKVGIGVAYCFNAYLVALIAPRKLRTFLAVSTLLLPAGLYEIAAGYREPFAVSLAFFALLLTRRARFTFATILFCAAASISETLLPLVLFPAALRLTGANVTVRRALPSASLALFGILIFAAEWLLLIPRETARYALAYRFGEAPLGGASWAGALSGLHILPSWLPAHSALFGAGVFCVFAFFPSLRLRGILLEPVLSFEKRYVETLGTFVAFLAAFFLAFRGIDPNTWYTIILMTCYYFASKHPTSPFPIVFGTVLAFAVYAVAGLGDFVNHTALWPFDRGLLGILGVSRYVFDLMQNALALCLIVAISLRDTELLFSSNSLSFFVLFVASVATTAIRFYLLDFVVLGAGLLVVALTLKRQIDSQRLRYRTPARPTAARTLRRGAFPIGLCDVVFAIGAVGIVSVQRGLGATSIVGWVILIGGGIFALLDKLKTVNKTSQALREREDYTRF